MRWYCDTCVTGGKIDIDLSTLLVPPTHLDMLDKIQKDHARKSPTCEANPKFLRYN